MECISSSGAASIFAVLLCLEADFGGLLLHEAVLSEGKTNFCMMSPRGERKIKSNCCCFHRSMESHYSMYWGNRLCFFSSSSLWIHNYCILHKHHHRCSFGSVDGLIPLTHLTRMHASIAINGKILHFYLIINQFLRPSARPSILAWLPVCQYNRTFLEEVDGLWFASGFRLTQRCADGSFQTRESRGQRLGEAWLYLHVAVQTPVLISLVWFGVQVRGKKRRSVKCMFARILQFKCHMGMKCRSASIVP